MNKRIKKALRKALVDYTNGKSTYLLINASPVTGKTQTIQKYIKQFGFPFEYLTNTNKGHMGNRYVGIICDDIEHRYFRHKQINETKAVGYVENVLYTKIAPVGIFIIIGSVHNEHSLPIHIQKMMYTWHDYPKFKVINYSKDVRNIRKRMSKKEAHFLMDNGKTYIKLWKEMQDKLPY